MPRKPASRIVQDQDTAVPGASGASARDGGTIAALGLTFLLGVLITQPGSKIQLMSVVVKDKEVRPCPLFPRPGPGSAAERPCQGGASHPQVLDSLAAEDGPDPPISRAGGT